MEIGEYCRTKDGYIGNIINTNEFRPPEWKICMDAGLNDYIFISEEDIKVHSYNNEDLIEIGDIVKIYNKQENKTYILILDNKNIEACKLRVKYKIINIKTILTHEMYEKNCYKVGED